MENQPEHQSEIAHLRRQLDLEAEAAWNALHGLAVGMAKHQFINARMERLGTYHQQLKELVGEEEAIKAVAQAMQQAGDAAQ